MMRGKQLVREVCGTP